MLPTVSNGLSMLDYESAKSAFFSFVNWIVHRLPV